MAKDKMPVTPAKRFLQQHKVEFIELTYQYVEHGGTAVSAKELNVDEHMVIKTIILEDEHKAPLVVLMHGDLQISTKNLARFIGAKSINPCIPEVANKHTGYLVGGTSPFGTRKKMPIYMEETIKDLPFIHINGGKRGYLFKINPLDLIRVLSPTLVNIGIK